MLLFASLLVGMGASYCTPLPTFWVGCDSLGMNLAIPSIASYVFHIRPGPLLGDPFIRIHHPRRLQAHKSSQATFGWCTEHKEAHPSVG